jgi:hypothetical protein
LTRQLISRTILVRKIRLPIQSSTPWSIQARTLVSTPWPIRPSIQARTLALIQPSTPLWI